MSVIEDWASSLDLKKQIDVFILDFEKAFDTVPHELLKSKLYSLGVSKQVLRWIDDFLSDRKQALVVNGTRSPFGDVVSGVPQGSVLGPILFFAHINDIVNAATSNLRLFADDCVCYRVIENASDCRLLQDDINNLGLWAKTWGMRFQPSKCNIITLTRKTSPVLFDYALNGEKLIKVDSVKYLGVCITSNLNWDKHIQAICNKGNRILGILQRNLSFCSRDVKLAAYKGLLRPVLEYASSVWDPHQTHLQDRLESVQRRSARFISGDFSREPGSMTSILKDLDLPTLTERRRQNRLILFTKGFFGKARIPMDRLRHPIRRTRGMHNLHLCHMYSRTNCYKFSFLPNTVIDWNSLPADLIDSTQGHKDPVQLITSFVRA